MHLSAFGRRRLSLLIAITSLFVLAVQPAAAATAKFGARLSPGIFPSNAYPGMLCDQQIDGGSDVYPCTWILNQAFSGGTVTAPKNGFINKVKIINGQGGAFKLVIAQKNAAGQFRVLRMSAKINYSTDACSPDCVVHKYNIAPLQVSTGNYVGIQATKTSMLRCDSGGPKIYLFRPPLPAGGPYVAPTDNSGCWLLVQAIYQP